MDSCNYSVFKIPCEHIPRLTFYWLLSTMAVVVCNIILRFVVVPQMVVWFEFSWLLTQRFVGAFRKSAPNMEEIPEQHRILVLFGDFFWLGVSITVFYIPLPTKIPLCFSVYAVACAL